MMQHVKDKSHRASVRDLKIPAWIIAKLKLERHLENAVEKMMLSYPRSFEATNRFKKEKPAVLVSNRTISI